MSALQAGYSMTDVSRVTGLSMDQLRTYDRMGYLRPSVAPARGRGTGRARVYSYSDIIILRVMAILRDMGIEPMNMTQVVDFLQEKAPDLPAAGPQLLFATDRQRTFLLLDDPLALLARLDAGEPLVTLSLGRIVREIRCGLAQGGSAGAQMRLPRAASA